MLSLLKGRKSIICIGLKRSQLLYNGHAHYKLFSAHAEQQVAITPTIDIEQHVTITPTRNIEQQVVITPTREIHHNFSSLLMSATLELNERQKVLQKEGRVVYRFGFGESPMPVPKCMVNKLCEYSRQKEYLPVRGLLPLRECIASYYNSNFSDFNYNINPEQIMVTPGTKQALFLIQLALSHNCEILLPSPSWVSYKPQAQLSSKGSNIQWINTDFNSKWKIDPKEFEDKHLKKNPNKQRLLILNSPSNPTGVVYTNKELSELSDVCRKYHVIVLSDEIYGELYHCKDTSSYSSMHQYYPEGTIIQNGISKAWGAGGWRMGFAIFPPELKWLSDAVYIGSSETFTSVAAPIQYAAMEAFNNHNSEELNNYLGISREILKCLANHSYNLLSSIPGCNVIKPDGGFYIFPDFSNVKNIDKLKEKWSNKTGQNMSEWNCKQFCLFVLDECGVAGLHGSAFGREQNELSVRLAYVDFDGNDLMTHLLNKDAKKEFDAMTIGSNEMNEFLETHCFRTMEGMRILNEYMSSL